MFIISKSNLGPSNPNSSAFTDKMPWARHEMHSLPVGFVGALVKDITATLCFLLAASGRWGGPQIGLIL